MTDFNPCHGRLAATTPVPSIHTVHTIVTPKVSHVSRRVKDTGKKKGPTLPRERQTGFKTRADVTTAGQGPEEEYYINCLVVLKDSCFL